MTATGWDPIDASAWPFIATSLAKPWPREAVCFDLRWWAARERRGEATRPGRPALCERYGWREKTLRLLMADVERWEDPAHPVDRYSKGQPRASEGPAKGQRGASVDTDERHESEEKGQRRASEGPAKGQPRATRALYSPYTDTDTDTGESHPPTADGEPAPESTDPIDHPDWKPPSQRTYGTRETSPEAPSVVPDGGVLPLTPPAPVDAPESLEIGPRSHRKRGAASGPTEADLEAWRACLAEWGKIRPDNAAKLSPDKGAGLQLLDAIRKLGRDRLLARLRWAATGTTWAAQTARASDRALSELLRDRNGLVDRLDAEAEDAGALSVAVVDPAWDDFATRAERITSVRPPNRPEAFGDRFGVDLADDRAEHARRFAAMRAAGGVQAWLRHESRPAFRAAFVAAMSAGGVAA